MMARKHPARRRDPTTLLPLTDLAFNVLVALAEGDQHGYALIKEIRSRSGRSTLRTGTLYAALRRLEDDGLIAESDGREREEDDQRRRYYRITRFGRETARAEAERLRALLGVAVERDLLRDAPTS